jgi:hypothetical protein
MDSYYDEALKRYKKVPYYTLHEYHTQGLSEWYARFKPNAANDMEKERDEHDEQEVHRKGGHDAALTDTITFSTTRKSAAAAAPAPAPAAAVPPGTAAGPP